MPPAKKQTKGRKKVYTLRGKGKVTVTGATQKKVPRPRGRPPEHEMPERIDASPETIAEVVLQSKPKTVCRYEGEARRKRLGLARTGEG